MLDAKLLVEKVARKNNIVNSNSVRCDMDRTLNERLDSINTSAIYDVFGNNYDGRKICLKYFIELNVKYLEKQNSYCTYKK